MKKYSKPCFEKVCVASQDVVTGSTSGLINRPVIDNTNEVPGVPLV